MASISYSRFGFTLTIACLLAPIANAIDCYHSSTIKPCASPVDTCYWKGIDRIGWYTNIKLTGCYEEGETLDLPLIGRVTLGSCYGDPKMCCCKKDGCNRSLESCRAANSGGNATENSSEVVIGRSENSSVGTTTTTTGVVDRRANPAVKVSVYFPVILLCVIAALIIQK